MLNEFDCLKKFIIPKLLFFFFFTENNYLFRPTKKPFR